MTTSLEFFDELKDNYKYMGMKGDFFFLSHKKIGIIYFSIQNNKLTKFCCMLLDLLLDGKIWKYQNKTFKVRFLFFLYF